MKNLSDDFIYFEHSRKSVHLKWVTTWEFDETLDKNSCLYFYYLKGYVNFTRIDNNEDILWFKKLIGG